MRDSRGLASRTRVEGFDMPSLALNQTSRYSRALIKRTEPRAARESAAKHDRAVIPRLVGVIASNSTANKRLAAEVSLDPAGSMKHILPMERGSFTAAKLRIRIVPSDAIS